MNKYCDALVVVPRKAYEAATDWEKGNTHYCCGDDDVVVLQVRMKLETYENDYSDCSYCYPTVDSFLTDYQQFAGEKSVVTEEGETIMVSIFQPTTWGEQCRYLK